MISIIIIIFLTITNSKLKKDITRNSTCNSENVDIIQKKVIEQEIPHNETNSIDDYRVKESVESIYGNENIDYSKLNEAEKLLYDFGFYDNIWCGIKLFSTAYTEETKKIIALEKVPESKKIKKKCSEIYSSDDFERDHYKIKELKFGLCEANGEAELIPYDEVNKIYKSMYGTNIEKKAFESIRNESFKGFYDYKESLNSFVKLTCRCGGTCDTTDLISLIKVKSSNLVNNELIIDVYYFYGSVQRYTNDVISIYTSRSGTILLETKDLASAKKDENYIFKSVIKKIG